MGNSNEKEKEPNSGVILLKYELISEERQQEASQDERQQAKQEKKWHDGKGFHHERLKGTILSDGYSLEEIYEMLDKSKTFAFCVFKETTEPFRHCGIAMVFDGKPTYTLNIDAKLSPKMIGFIVKCKSRIVVRDVPPPEDVTYSDPIFDMNIEDEEETARVKEVIKIWMEEKAAYSLSEHNCRDHAEESIDEAAEILACSPEGVEKAKELLERTRQEDNENYKVPLAGVEALKLMKELTKKEATHVKGLTKTGVDRAIKKMNEFHKDNTKCSVM